MKSGVSILPSLLAADFGSLESEIRRAQASGADALHLDIMDAHFVPNLSFGPDVVALSRRVAPDFYRHVHLMMTRPDLYLEAFANAGAQTIQIHVEADCDVHVQLRRIAAMGLRQALVVNPETPVEALYPYLGETPEVDIVIDGGANAETSVQAVEAGANMIVAGSYLFRQSDMKSAVSALRASCASARHRGGLAVEV